MSETITIIDDRTGKQITVPITGVRALPRPPATAEVVPLVAGLAIPLILDRMGIDPALAGSVILTTVTDVVGFFAFLGLATVLLL